MGGPSAARAARIAAGPEQPGRQGEGAQQPARIGVLRAEPQPQRAAAGDRERAHGAFPGDVSGGQLENGERVPGDVVEHVVGDPGERGEGVREVRVDRGRGHAVVAPSRRYGWWASPPSGPERATRSAGPKAPSADE
ncbi:hypothetical protein L083_3444 [Actinoplanes sp. N902-109]|nr:hypothetical protein L083_3444 [Actinoplanes sp. N902-109]